MKINTLLFASLFLFACQPSNTNEANDTSQVDSSADAQPAVELDSVPAEPVPDARINWDTANQYHVSIGGLHIYIDSFDVWEGGSEMRTDTFFMSLELGETIEARNIVIGPMDKPTKSIKVYQRFENSITLMDEGPHCDLTQWKHYYSDWKELAIVGNHFKTDKYTPEDWQTFLPIDMDELHAAILEHCGKEWARKMANLKSPTEYPSGVGTSKIFLKFIIEYTDSDDVEEKTLTFEIPMGC